VDEIAPDGFRKRNPQLSIDFPNTK